MLVTLKELLKKQKRKKRQSEHLTEQPWKRYRVLSRQQKKRIVR